MDMDMGAHLHILNLPVRYSVLSYEIFLSGYKCMCIFNACKEQGRAGANSCMMYDK